MLGVGTRLAEGTVGMAEGGDRHFEQAAKLPGEDVSAILGRAMDILAEVHRLLEALAPDDVEVTAARMHIGLEQREDRLAVLWKVYVARHRVLMDVFTRQYAELVAQARRAGAASREDPR
jgi:hypothetical protein